MSDLEPIEREHMWDGFLKLVNENTTTDEQARKVVYQCWMLVCHYRQAEFTPAINTLCTEIYNASTILCNPKGHNITQLDLSMLALHVNNAGGLIRDPEISSKEWNDKLINFKQYIDERAEIYLHCPLREFNRVTVGLDDEEEEQKRYNTFLAHRALITLVNQSMDPPTQSSSSPPDSIQELYETVVFPVLINGFHVGISLDKGAGGLYG